MFGVFVVARAVRYAGARGVPRAVRILLWWVVLGRGESARVGQGQVLLIFVSGCEAWYDQIDYSGQFDVALGHSIFLVAWWEMGHSILTEDSIYILFPRSWD